MIDLCIPYVSGNEIKYIEEALKNKKIAGLGPFAKKCQTFFEERYGFKKCLLTTSCTDALEMTALLLNILPGDEVIMPSYTFVSTANAFELRKASIIFADTKADFPVIDETKIEALITKRTKAIIVVHYAGVSCDMDVIMDLAKKYNLIVIEDAAQAIDAYYKGNALGSIGHMSTFSFHETKNIIAGECGMLVINEERFINRAEIILEKGTNRSAFLKGEVDKYGWVEVGSSFLSSELVNSFLYGQLLELENIQRKRLEIWNLYKKNLLQLAENGSLQLSHLPSYSTHNGHIFFLVCKSSNERTGLMKYLKENGISTAFHYLSLHSSAYFASKYKGAELVNSDMFTDQLLRLPLHMYLENTDVEYITNCISSFFFKNLKNQIK